MGQKTHPIGFRLGTTRDWSSHWFGSSPKNYRDQVFEDHEIRSHIEAVSYTHLTLPTNREV